MGGVMERFPHLRMAFLEAQCGWLPFWLHRMDEHYSGGSRTERWTHLSMPPSEYFRRGGFCAVECDEGFVGHVVQAIGDDNLRHHYRLSARRLEVPGRHGSLPLTLPRERHRPEEDPLGQRPETLYSSDEQPE